MTTDSVEGLRKGDRLPELDGFRGVAVLVVVLFHFAVATPGMVTPRPFAAEWPAWLRNLGCVGWCGVDFFFVLSGFLIGGILLDHRRSGNLWRAFYARRVTRIFPLYFLLVAITWMPGIGIASHLHGPHTPLAAYLFFVENYWRAAAIIGPIWLSPCWSVAIEEQFYLVAPWVISRLSKRRLVIVLLGCIAGAILLRTVLLWFPSTHWHVISPRNFTPCRLDELALGVLGALSIREEKPRRWLEGHLGDVKRAGVIFLVGLGLIGQAAPYRWGYRLGDSAGEGCAAGLALCVILPAVLDRAGWIARALRWKGLRIAGQWSYFIYLFHLMFLTLTYYMGDVAYWRKALAALLTTGILAALSWRFLEEPLLRLGRSVPYEPRAPADLAIGG